MYRGSAVGIAAGYAGPPRGRSPSPGKVKNFSSPPLGPTQPPIQRVVVPGVKRQGREANLTPSS
jgi:hypothetical protein